MQIYKYLSIVTLGCALYAGQAIAQHNTAGHSPAHHEAEGKAIATEMLKSQGHSDAEIKDALENPASLPGLSVCEACRNLESVIGDPDTNCGGKSSALTCGIYIAGSLSSYIAGHRATACAKITNNQSTICGWG